MTGLAMQQPFSIIQLGQVAALETVVLVGSRVSIFPFGARCPRYAEPLDAGRNTREFLVVRDRPRLVDCLGVTVRLLVTTPLVTVSTVVRQGASVDVIIY